MTTPDFNYLLVHQLRRERLRDAATERLVRPRALPRANRAFTWPSARVFVRRRLRRTAPST
jgi:hypothetical protein